MQPCPDTTTTTSTAGTGRWAIASGPACASASPAVVDDRHTG